MITLEYWTPRQFPKNKIMLPKKKNKKLTLRNDHGQKEHVFSLVVVTRQSRKTAEIAVLCAFAKRWPDGMEFKLRRGQPK